MHCQHGAALPGALISPVEGFTRETQFHVDVGKEYLVYGMTLYRGFVWYYLCDEAFLYYPRWNPSSLFEVRDGRLSRYWRFAMVPASTRGAGGDPEYYTDINFPEWLENPYYYDQLTDGEEDAVAVFRRYRKLIEEEFAFPGELP